MTKQHDCHSAKQKTNMATAAPAFVFSHVLPASSNQRGNHSHSKV